MAGVAVPTQGQWSVALLGKNGPDKSSVADKLRRDESSEDMGVRKVTGSNLTVVEGFHALLLVLPVVSGKIPTEEEIESHCQRIELMSEVAWRYTIVLFSCMGNVEQPVIDQHLEAAKKLLEKCDGRHLVLQSDTPISKLLQKIEELVEKNKKSCLTIQECYEGISFKVTQLKKQLEETQQKLKHEDGATKRRGSAETPPSVAEGKAAPQEQTKFTLLSPPAVVIMMAFAGAVIGIVIGATEGAPGSGLVRGFILGVVLAVMMLGAISFLDRPNATDEKKKPDAGGDASGKPKEQ